MRRLPVYLVIDVSESMVGEPITWVEEGLGLIMRDLRRDPNALETVWISVIAFAGKAKKITPLVDVTSFYPPKLPIGGGTSLGNALELLMQDLDANIVKTTMEVKGDWKPVVFLFTDGAPTDNYKAAVDKWNAKYRSKAFLVAISFGADANNTVLNQLTDTVLIFNNESQHSYTQFFKWVTASIRTTSIGVSENMGAGITLAKIDKTILAEAEILVKENGGQKIDDNYAVILSKCQTTKRPYLIKYKRTTAKLSIPGLDFDTRVYMLQGAFPIDNQYFDLTEGTVTGAKISTEDLSGFPGCPCCSNRYGFSTCACGGIMCTGDDEVNTCPWCGTVARFGIAEGSQDVNRTKG